MTMAAPKKSDLGVRSVSAVFMIAVAGTALWLGGYFWTAFVVTIALGVFWEWMRLSRAAARHPVARGLWNAGGIIYIAMAAGTLAQLRTADAGLVPVLAVVGMVIATDIGAYFCGRTFGGPKIAPKISPSKTWSGLLGGMLGAMLVLGAMIYVQGQGKVGAVGYAFYLPWAALAAIVAQMGDFFESWMKRRAGVKDSSNLIPGHGGLFDRVDGLLAVCFILGILMLGTILLALWNGESLLPRPS